jgi:hypothetical protein
MDTSRIFDRSDIRVIAETRAWVERAVIGLNLCPFAKAVAVKGQIRYVVSAAPDEEGLLDELALELDHLARVPPEETETTLLIHPGLLLVFADYNDFFYRAEARLKALGYEGVLQLASFHPLYQFAGTASSDVSNATNRSPYPILHLLREASLDRAVAVFPDAAQIFEVNIETLNRLGPDGWAALQRSCADEGRAAVRSDEGGADREGQAHREGAPRS